LFIEKLNIHLGPKIKSIGLDMSQVKQLEDNPTFSFVQFIGHEGGD